MKNVFGSALLAGVLALSASGVMAQSVFSENFDGYADQAAFDAAWTPVNPGVVLKTDGGHSGSNYAQYPTTAARQVHGFTSVTPSDTAPLVLDFWIRPSVATNQGRATISLGQLSGTTFSPVIEFGEYNNPATTGWSARLVGGTPTPTSWAAVGGTRVANEWTNLKVIVQSRDAVFYENGVKLNTFSRTASNFVSLTGVSIGFNNTSAHTIDFDDIVISTTSNVSDWSVY